MSKSILITGASSGIGKATANARPFPSFESGRDRARA